MNSADMFIHAWIALVAFGALTLWIMINEGRRRPTLFELLFLAWFAFLLTVATVTP
jgi:hypothetical protein